MVKYVPIEPDNVDNIRRGRRGRVSYPILKGFLESGHFLVKLDTTGMQQSHQSLYSSLGSYIRNHELPIKLFSRAGDLHLMRLDIDKDGNKIENWQQKQEDRETATDKPLKAITSDEVERRFKEEKGKTTK